MLFLNFRAGLKSMKFKKFNSKIRSHDRQDVRSGCLSAGSCQVLTSAPDIAASASFRLIHASNELAGRKEHQREARYHQSTIGTLLLRTTDSFLSTTRMKVKRDQRGFFFCRTTHTHTRLFEDCNTACFALPIKASSPSPLAASSATIIR